MDVAGKSNIINTLLFWDIHILAFVDLFGVFFLGGGGLPEFEWQQVSSSILDSSKYSVRSK